MKNAITRSALFSAAASALLFAGGCACPNNKCDKCVAGYDKDFPPESTVRAPDRFVAAQAASGARNDPTLHASDFDGQWLNSTGRTKINMLVHDRENPGPMTVYVDVPRGDHQRQAVQAYAQELGVAGVEVREGSAPWVSYPAAPAIEAMHRAELPAQAQGTTTTTTQMQTQSSPRTSSSGGSSGTRY
jgi:hypothetical protein